ncbi:hypothetical protein LPTSP3_g05320 [Leptospira kobayashii]|uniref:Uncharacterized protein n=1 Tax=Leptospira kobayashii TaxID=1917830 RepID=A0ABN6K9I2_9LEPT|nr:hypothetical protein [Leptospira kobayashii]BDA77602.1 hypothetical protein LPTSP3_g05320 [Leptospira kobayashii]
MSLCHPDKGSVSCGACCGLFNLKLDTEGYKKLLQDRTEEFQSNVNFSIRHSFPAYRQSREKLENEIPKKDDMTYNCPFLGYVNRDGKKIGCMIHPIFTGDPKSQNFSFYGASICQAYDCKNKEHELALLWEDLFVKVAEDSVQFSHLASDHILIYAIEKWIGFKNWNMEEGILRFQELIVSLFRIRLQRIANFNPTSFEVRYDSFPEESSVYVFLRENLGEGFYDLEEEMKKSPARID